jgi:hypothetical protein
MSGSNEGFEFVGGRGVGESWQNKKAKKQSTKSTKYTNIKTRRGSHT